MCMCSRYFFLIFQSMMAIILAAYQIFKQIKNIIIHAIQPIIMNCINYGIWYHEFSLTNHEWTTHNSQSISFSYWISLPSVFTSLTITIIGWMMNGLQVAIFSTLFFVYSSKTKNWQSKFSHIQPDQFKLEYDNNTVSMCVYVFWIVNEKF